MSEGKKKTYLVLGICALVLGLYINFVALYVIVRGRGNVYEFLRFGIALLLFWMAYRAIKMATSSEYALRKRVTIWKVALGSLITWSAIHSYYFPAANMLKANNAGEQQGMFVAMILFTLFGLWVIYRGFRTKFAAQS